MKNEFMKLGPALEIVLKLAKQNVADQLDHPKHHTKQESAINIVEDWATNNLDEDD